MIMSANSRPEKELPIISKPANQALDLAGYYKLEQFTEVTEAELLKLHGMGPKGIRMLKAALQERGLSFAKKS
ncbi:DNA-binding protein [Paenibacillus paeoniae]|uniref:DNA-binding protein n=2 Tax=Paenibacillus paeoniae TaxID=2292705 RepID=A0A371PN08_9BACL|nr:DNA-binding protein [Paenibacillus paeoniae]